MSLQNRKSNKACGFRIYRFLNGRDSGNSFRCDGCSWTMCNTRPNGCQASKVLMQVSTLYLSAAQMAKHAVVSLQLLEG